MRHVASRGEWGHFHARSSREPINKETREVRDRVKETAGPDVWGQVSNRGGAFPQQTVPKGIGKRLRPMGPPQRVHAELAVQGTYMCAVAAPADTDHVLFLNREDLSCQLQADVTGASRPFVVQQGEAGSGLWGQSSNTGRGCEHKDVAATTVPQPSPTRPRDTPALTRGAAHPPPSDQGSSDLTHGKWVT